MKLSLNWLADFVDLKAVAPAELAAELTEKVAEVEQIVSTGIDIPKVIVGKILKIAPIEGADKIRLTTVDIGSGQLSIICGAQNIYEGAVVPVAVVGAVLPGDFKIEKRKMRGIESCGMICSESELGLAEASEGIMLLPEDTPIGTPVSETLPSDTIFEIDNHAITHRADLFSQLGFAREIAVLLDKNFKHPKSELIKLNGQLKVTVKEKSLCPRYLGLKVSGIKVQPSPQQIQERLTACGVRPINNVVDATNYVLLELGQPLHAFDAARLAGSELNIRKAKAGEELKTLDSVERKLTADMLVVADKEKPVAIAGVIGGANSEVSDGTTEIVLEAANFEAANVRQTATALGVRTESSLRFEKRLDPELPPVALARCLKILKETCPKLKVEAGIDVANFKPEQRKLALSLENLNNKLGVQINPQTVEKILKALGFGVTSKKDSFEVIVPSFRAGRDITEEIDLIEEVARHSGYNQIPAEFPVLKLASPERDSARELQIELEDALVGYGFHETNTLSLVSAKALEKSNLEPTLAASLVNPPSDDYKYLRPRLLTSLLTAAETNIKNIKAFRLFEVSTVFEKTSKDIIEYPVCVGLIVGEPDPYAAVHGVAESLLTGLKFEVEFIATETGAKVIHPGRAADIQINGQTVGLVAEVHPAVATDFDLPRSAYIYLDLTILQKIKRETVVARSLPKFPGVPRDLAVVLPVQTLVADVIKVIQSADPRITELALFDTYTGEGVESGQKSLAFSFVIQDKTKTLSDVESEAILAKITKSLLDIGGQIRT